MHSTHVNIHSCIHASKPLTQTQTTPLHMYVHIHTQFGIRWCVPHHLSLVTNAPPSYLPRFLMYTDKHSSRHKHTQTHAQATALRVVGCYWTLHLYVHHVHWKKRSDKENKHAHTHAQTHTCRHMRAHKKKSYTLRHALWSPCMDQNSFLSAFPSKSIALLVDRQP